MQKYITLTSTSMWQWLTYSCLSNTFKYMRTTVRLHDDLLERARKRAVEEGRTLTSLIEEGLTLALTRPRAERRERVELPVSQAAGGVLPGVDLNCSSTLEELMEGS